MDYYLFLDDVRFPQDAFNYTKDNRYLKLDWIIVRSYDEFIDVVNNKGLPKIVSCDHDLADEHYDRDDDGVIDYFSYNEKTGYDCAKWICNYCIENKKKLPEVLIHSWNNVGAENIINYISNFKKNYPELN